MSKRLIAIVVCLLAAIVPAATATATLEWMHNTSAVCLDGSPAAYYFQQGSPGNKTFVFMLEGGGLCSHEEDCLGRAKTALGSSTFFHATINLPAFQSDDAAANPDWHDANMVFLPYCTGDLHAGTRARASNDTWGLHFDGHHVVQAMIAQLKTRRDLGAADLVVFAGGSAGGMGVFYNVDYVASQLPGVRVLGMPIGGYIFAHPNYSGPGAGTDPETADEAAFKRDAALYQAGDAATARCARALGDANAWRCLEPTVLYKFVQTPLLILESQTDSVVMFGFSDLPEALNADVENYVVAFRKNSTQLAHAVVASPKDAIFSACCFMHTNFARGSPTIGGTDYYDFLRAAVRAPAGKPPASLVDAGAGLPPPVGTCGTNCPKFGP